MKTFKTLTFIIAVLFLVPFTAKADMNDFLNAMAGMQAVKDVAKSEPVILNPEAKQKLKKIYVEIKNTSSVSDLSTDLAKTKVTEGLKAKGYEIVDNAEDAEYLLQADINKLNIMREKKSSFFGSILGAVGKGILGVAGAFAGAATGNADIAVMAADVGGSVGSSAGEAVGGALDDSVAGYNYSYLGSFTVVVTEKYNGNTKTYNGKYPLFGDSKDIKGTITEDISEKVAKVLVEIY